MFHIYEWGINMYWAYAIVREPITKKVVLENTYDGSFTYQGAREQIEIWKRSEEYIVYFAYITDDAKHILHYESYVDQNGYVNYDTSDLDEISDGTLKKGM